MNRLDQNWRTQIRRRFADRVDIGRDELYTRYFAPVGLPKEDVIALLELIELELELPSGLLRPDDSLAKLAEPVPAKNLWQWMVYQVRSGDRALEIDEQLEKRMRRYGMTGLWSNIETVGDLVRAWCGMLPPDESMKS